MFAPAPAAGAVAARRITGRRMLPSTRPATPPAMATAKHQTATTTRRSGPASTARHLDEGRVVLSAPRGCWTHVRWCRRARRGLMAIDAPVPLPRLPTRRQDGRPGAVRLVPQLRPVARRRLADHRLGAALRAPEREAPRAEGA